MDLTQVADGANLIGVLEQNLLEQVTGVGEALVAIEHLPLLVEHVDLEVALVVFDVDGSRIGESAELRQPLLLQVQSDPVVHLLLPARIALGRLAQLLYRLVELLQHRRRSALARKLFRPVHVEVEHGDVDPLDLTQDARLAPADMRQLLLGLVVVLLGLRKVTPAIGLHGLDHELLGRQFLFLTADVLVRLELQRLGLNALRRLGRGRFHCIASARALLLLVLLLQRRLLASQLFLDRLDRGVACRGRLGTPGLARVLGVFLLGPAGVGLLLRLRLLGVVAEIEVEVPIVGLLLLGQERPPSARLDSGNGACEAKDEKARRSQPGAHVPLQRVDWSSHRTPPNE